MMVWRRTSTRCSSESYSSVSSPHIYIAIVLHGQSAAYRRAIAKRRNGTQSLQALGHCHKNRSNDEGFYLASTTRRHFASLPNRHVRPTPEFLQQSTPHIIT